MDLFPAALLFADIPSFSILLEKLVHTKDLAGGSEVNEWSGEEGECSHFSYPIDLYNTETHIFDKWLLGRCCG